MQLPNFRYSKYPSRTTPIEFTWEKEHLGATLHKLPTFTREEWPQAPRVGEQVVLALPAESGKVEYHVFQVLQVVWVDGNALVRLAWQDIVEFVPREGDPA